MNTRRMRTGFRKYSLYAALAGLGLMGWTSSAVAQTLGGGSVSGQAGQTAQVPITINTASANVAFFAVTFTVVAQGGAPAITDKLDYQAATGVPAPDLKTAVQAQAKLAVGYVGVTIDPALSGTLQVGTLTVPIPAGATTGSYDVQLSKISAGDSSGGKVTVTGQNGTITIGGVPPPTPTQTPPTVVVSTATPTAGAVANSLSGGSVSGQAGQTAQVPITINTGSNNVAFFAVTFTVVAQGGAPAITDKLDYQAATGVPAPDLKTAVQAQAKLAVGYVGVTIDPALSGTLQVGTLTVPIPAGATTGSYDVQLSKISAGDSSGGKVTLTGQNGTITLGGGVGTATPTQTSTGTASPTKTPPTVVGGTATPTRTATATAAATAPTPPSALDEDGCQIGAKGTGMGGWLLLIPAVGLLVVRRRRR